MDKEEEISIGPSIKVKKSSNEVSVDWTKLGYTNETLDRSAGGGQTVREQMNQLTSKLVHAVTEEEKTVISVNGFVQGGGHMGSVLDAIQTANIIKKELRKGEASTQTASSTVRPVVMQGDTRGLQPTGLHTLTAAEIVANANKRDPTAPHYEEGGNVGRWVDPLAPHADFSGEVPRIVNPLKPGPKISGPA